MTVSVFAIRLPTLRYFCYHIIGLTKVMPFFKQISYLYLHFYHTV